jgi:16S rRNA (guanine966-N2)-methyltransferase
MVRESLFNILRDDVTGRPFVDLFAGTGAIGLEALSRGAERAIFVERDRENIGLIHRNVATLRYEDQAQVRLLDAYRWSRSFRPEELGAITVFLDPPYRDYETRAKAIRQLLENLMMRLPAGSTIALEAGRRLDERVVPRFEDWDVRRYGDTRIAIFVTGGAGVDSEQSKESGTTGTEDDEGASGSDDLITRVSAIGEISGDAEREVESKETGDD